MYESLDRGLVQMTNVTCRLPGFLTSHDGLRVDGSESVNDDFASYRLNWVDHDGDCSRVELLE